MICGRLFSLCFSGKLIVAYPGQSLDGFVLLLIVQSGALYGIMQHDYGAVVSIPVHWEWSSILAAMGKTKLGWIPPAR